MRNTTKPPGLKLRAGYWHIHKVIRAGSGRIELQEATGFAEGQIREAAAHLRRRIAEEQAKLINPPPPQERTFDQAAVEYAMDLQRRGKDNDQRSIQDLERLSPWIGHLPLSHVHQGALGPFEAAMRGHISSGTVARAYRTAVAVLNLSARVLRDGNRPWLTQPVPKIRAPDWQDRRQPYRLTWEEQDAILAELATHLIPPVLFALGTGAREQEVVSLRWDQAVKASGLPVWAVWWIPPAIRKGSSKTATSEQEGRYLVAGAMARSVIAAQERVGPWVFPGPSGERMRGLTNTGWIGARKRAGLPGVRIHDLRHTFGTRLEAAGVPWEYRKVLLGHRISDITAHYSAPGLARLIDYADSVTRETAPTLRPVSVQNP